MARLTKDAKPKLPIVYERRRHADPPVLWLVVATGSVVFHLLLAVIILPLQAQRVGEEAQLDPVAIDLIELDVEAEAPVAPVAIAPASPSSEAISQQPESVPQSIETFPSPPPEAEPTLEPIPQPSPEAELDPPTEAPIPAPTQTPVAEPQQPVENTPLPSENQPSAPTGSNSGDSLATGDSGNPTVPDDAVPDDGSPSAPVEDDGGLPSVAVDANSSSAGWLTSAVVSQRPDRPFDVPTQLATIKPGSERLPEPTRFGCPVESGMETQLTEQEQYAQYLAEAAPYLNTPVNINVTVEANGQVSEASVGSEASTSHAYNQLAICLVTNWLEFNPALRDGEPWASDNQQVTITISSIQ